MSQRVQYISGDFEGYYYTHQSSPLSASEKLPGGATHSVHIYRGKLDNAGELSDYQPSNYLDSDSLLLHNVNHIEAKLSGIDRKIFDLDQAVLTDIQVLQSWELQGKTYGIIKGKLYGKVKEAATPIDSTQKLYSEPVQSPSSRLERLTGWWKDTKVPVVGAGGVVGGNSGCLSTIWDILKWLLLLLVLYLLFHWIEGCFGKSRLVKSSSIVDTSCCKVNDSLIEENRKVRVELDSFKFRSQALEDSLKKNEIQEQLDELSSMIFFFGGKTIVRKFSEDQLTKIVELLNKYPNLHVEVRGYHNYDPDNPETMIDEDRAEKVKNMLIQRGLDESRIDSRGMGRSDIDDYRDLNTSYDFDTNSTFKWNRNMRVEVIIVKY